MRYTVDIPNRQPSYNPSFDDLTPLVSEQVCGIYAYVEAPYAERIVTALSERDGRINEDEPWHWSMDSTDETNLADFNASKAKNDMDVLRLDGENIGYIMRNNPASLRLLQIMNGMPVDPIQAEPVV